MNNSSLKKKIKRLQDELSHLKQELQLGSVKNYIFPQLMKINGVSFSAVCSDIKKNEKLDLTLMEIRSGATVSAVFTKSGTRSSPVRWCEEILKRRKPNQSGKVAILVNSGNANTFTGMHGERAVRSSVECVSKNLGCDEKDVFVASTGVIGEILPVAKIITKIPDLCQALSPSGIAYSAEAIMTTDTFPKGSMKKVIIEGKEISIAGIAKGSGMIAPDMATMLGFIFTDISIDEILLQESLEKVVENTFNSISVDGDTSTSDTVMLVATGSVEGLHISSIKDKGYDEFINGITLVMKELSHLIVKDGEGATKFVEINVSGAISPGSAKGVCRSIANSPLVKTAINGEDPNWGRIIMAIGKSGETVERDKITIKFGEILVAENGWVASSYSEKKGSDYMKKHELKITVDLGLGNYSSSFWTCDFSDEYISINADYRS